MLDVTAMSGVFSKCRASNQKCQAENGQLFGELQKKKKTSHTLMK